MAKCAAVNTPHEFPVMYIPQRQATGYKWTWWTIRSSVQFWRGGYAMMINFLFIMQLVLHAPQQSKSSYPAFTIPCCFPPKAWYLLSICQLVCTHPSQIWRSAGNFKDTVLAGLAHARVPTWHCKVRVWIFVWLFPYVQWHTGFVSLHFWVNSMRQDIFCVWKNQGVF